jgi:non-ribosomal peptide synthetase component F
LFDLFNESAQAYPDKIAISFHDRSLTYTEVANTANRIAALLVQKGIKKATLLGWHWTVLPEMIISLLAIMKSGAAYVPLDPEYPKDRIEFMLEDSGAKILITSAKYAGHYAANTIEVLIEQALTDPRH